jgi:hypothetical protein
MHRRRRGFFERFLHAAVYICPDCRHEAPVSQLRVHPGLSLTTCCPRCANTRLKRLPKRDHIEGLYRNPISHIQAWFGAPLYYCQYCRLQFYDFRRRESSNSG